MVTLDCALAMKQYETIDLLEITGRESRSIDGYRIYKEAEVEHDCVVGDFANICPNAAVVRDIPDCVTAVGVPARVIG